ncbi:hypothetical protein MCEZE4_01340 [Burkholderiaceae bacterium]|jgi:hypothetical protein
MKLSVLLLGILFSFNAHAKGVRLVCAEANSSTNLLIQVHHHKQQWVYQIDELVMRNGKTDALGGVAQISKNNGIYTINYKSNTSESKTLINPKTGTMTVQDLADGNKITEYQCRPSNPKK